MANKKILNDFAALAQLKKDIKKEKKKEINKNLYQEKPKNVRRSRIVRDHPKGNNSHFEQEADKGFIDDGRNATMADYFPNDEKITAADKLGLSRGKKKKEEEEDEFLNISQGFNTSRHSLKGGALMEVDLHIDALNPGRTLEKHEFLEYQMNIFNMVMRQEIHHIGKKIVFIHGVGEGKLREAIIDRLDNNYWTCIYQDAPFHKYGVSGAIQVTIR